RHRARMRRADVCRKLALEPTEHGPERQPAGAQHFEHAFLLLRPDHGTGERQLLGAHDPGADAAGRDAVRRGRCIPYWSESTSASQDASITFSETPIEPHPSSPSEESISTRVIDSVPACSSISRTLKFSSLISARCGYSSPIASRRARSSACTG